MGERMTPTTAAEAVAAALADPAFPSVALLGPHGSGKTRALEAGLRAAGVRDADVLRWEPLFDPRPPVGRAGAVVGEGSGVVVVLEDADAAVLSGACTGAALAAAVAAGPAMGVRYVLTCAAGAAQEHRGLQALVKAARVRVELGLGPSDPALAAGAAALQLGAGPPPARACWDLALAAAMTAKAADNGDDTLAALAAEVAALASRVAAAQKREKPVKAPARSAPSSRAARRAEPAAP